MEENKTIKFLSNIWNIIKNPSILIVILSIIIILLFTGWIRSCSNSSNENNRLNQNLSALNDTLRTERDKIGRLTTVTTTYIAEKDELKKLNKELYDELQKAKKNVQVITITNVEYRDRPIYINNDIQVDKDRISLNWLYEKDTIGFYQKISGISSIKIDTTNRELKITDLGTIISENLLKMKLVSTIRYNEDTDLYETTVTSPYNKIKFDIQTNIDPSITKYNQKDNFMIGPTVGVIGLSGNYSGNVNSNISWFVGLGVTYRLWSF